MQRLIRSFVCRNRLMTQTQHAFWQAFYQQYSLKDLDFFKNKPILEIGFGDGENLYTLAEKYPELFWLGIEVYQDGFRRLFRRLEEKGLDNLKVMCGNVVDFLEQVPANSLRGGLILYPDPWPKLKHHKRRLINEKFLALLVDKIEEGGIILAKTDHEGYAKQIGLAFSHFPLLSPIEPPWATVTTRFERKALQKNHPLFLFAFQKLSKVSLL